METKIPYLWLAECKNYLILKSRLLPRDYVPTMSTLLQQYIPHVVQNDNVPSLLEGFVQKKKKKVQPVKISLHNYSEVLGHNKLIWAA